MIPCRSLLSVHWIYNISPFLGQLKQNNTFSCPLEVSCPHYSGHEALTLVLFGFARHPLGGHPPTSRRSGRKDLFKSHKLMNFARVLHCNFINLLIITLCSFSCDGRIASVAFHPLPSCGRVGKWVDRWMEVKRKLKNYDFRFQQQSDADKKNGN